MSIVLGAFLPHAPLLLPTADPKHAQRLAPLKRAVEHIVQLAHAAQVQTVISFSPHALCVGNAFTFNLAEHLHAAFIELGDLSTTVTLPGDPKFAYHLKEHLEAQWPVASVTEDELNYGSGIPMLFFKATPNRPTWINISTRHSTPADHYRFGVALQEHLMNSAQRIAVLGSGELSARVSSASPVGKVDSAEAFCHEWRAALGKEALSAFLCSVPAELTEEVSSCGAWSASQLLGTLNTVQTQQEVLYDDTLFGIAYQAVTWIPK